MTLVNMLIKPTFPDQRIIDCLQIDYAIEISTLTYIPLGADTNASTYKAEAKNGSLYFVKLKRDHHHDISLTIVELLRNTGIHQIMPPIKTIHGNSIQYIDNFTLIVYPFIDGQNGFCRSLTDEQWLTLGKALRRIHEIDVPASIQHHVRREAYSPKWRDIVRTLYSHIEAKPNGDEIAVKLLAFMKENIVSIYRLVNRAEQLAEILRKETPKLVLCHSDLHGGNILMDGNNTIYIVDWDDPIMAPKERDLMFIGGGVGNVWNNPSEEVFFYEGYGETGVNHTILNYYRHERIVEDIAELSQYLLLSSAGSDDRLQSYNHFIDMFEPRGVVDIAFKTDENISLNDD